MKNKIFLYITTISLVLTMTACSSEEENIFDQSAAERLNSVSATYSGRLTNSKGGWVMEYYPYIDNDDPVTGVGYLIMNRYNSNGSVYTMMKNKATNNTKWDDTSAWEIITDMGPVLTYNTWNKCYGRFTDPVDIDMTTGRSDDESGKGFQGDYEFVMVDVPEGGDHIMLKGKKRGIYQRLTRLPEGTDFEAYLDDIDAFKSKIFISGAKWEIFMNDHSKRYRINNISKGLPTIYPDGMDSTAYGWHMPYMITKSNGNYYLRYKESVKKDDYNMEQEFVYNASDDKFHGVVDSNNIIEGGDPYDFFASVLENGGSRWEWDADSEMSDSYKTVFSAVVDDFKNILRYPLTSTSLRVNGGQLFLRFTYKQGKNNHNIDYVFEMHRNDGKVEFKFVKDNDTTAKNARTKLPNIQVLIDLLQQNWIPGASGSLFDLSMLKLVSSNDSNMWFLVTLK